MNTVPVSSHALVVAAIAVLVGWRIYRRVRRLIGRQEVHVRRLLTTAILFPVLLLFVGATSLVDPRLAEGIAAGAVVGIGLGLIGLRLTRYEAGADGYFYRPNTALGVAISLLFIGRLIYRFGAIYVVTGQFDPSTMQSFGRSPLTLALFGVVALYYTTFAIGILAWYRRARAGSSPGIDVSGA